MGIETDDHSQIHTNIILLSWFIALGIDVSSNKSLSFSFWPSVLICTKMELFFLRFHEEKKHWTYINLSLHKVSIVLKYCNCVRCSCKIFNPILVGEGGGSWYFSCLTHKKVAFNWLDNSFIVIRKSIDGFNISNARSTWILQS